MTEELLNLYKELYKTGVVFLRIEGKLNITATPKPEHCSQYQFPNSEYSTHYAKKLLRQLDNKWAIAKTVRKIIAVLSKDDSFARFIALEISVIAFAA
jgi:hypothetical protein